MTLNKLDPNQLPLIIRNFKEYVQRKDDIEQSLVDAVIITNFNPEMREGNNLRLVAFDFSLNNDKAIKEFSSSAIKNMKNLKEKPKTE